MKKHKKRLNLLKGLKFKIDRAALINLYKALIRPVLEYADVLWDNCTLRECDLIESIQYESARVITGAMKGTSTWSIVHYLLNAPICCSSTKLTLMCCTNFR